MIIGTFAAPKQMSNPGRELSHGPRSVSQRPAAAAFVRFIRSIATIRQRWDLDEGRIHAANMLVRSHSGRISWRTFSASIALHPFSLTAEDSDSLEGGGTCSRAENAAKCSRFNLTSSILTLEQAGADSGPSACPVSA